MSDHQEKAGERKVPVLRSENSLIKEEFDSIREKFQAEMGRMEEEMSRFRSQLIASEQRIMSQKSNSSSTSASSTSSTTRRSTTKQQVSSHKSAISSAIQSDSDWLEGLNSPLIKDNGGDKLLELRFDLTDYEPEHIAVKTIDNRLQVQARREILNENSSSYREYSREFLLPSGTNTELIRSSLTADGVLTIQAPLPVSNLLANN